MLGSPAAAVPSRCSCHSRAKKPNSEPIPRPAPRPNRDHSAMPSARNDTSPSQMALRKSTSSRGHCTPSARARRAANPPPAPPLAAKRSRSPTTRTTNHTRRANRKTSRNPPPARAARLLQMPNSRAPPTHGRAHSAVGCAAEARPLFRPGLTESPPVYPRGWPTPVRACAVPRHPPPQPRPFGAPARHGPPRFSDVRAPPHRVPLPASVLPAAAPARAAAPLLRDSSAPAQPAFSQRLSTTYHSRKPPPAMQQPMEPKFESSWILIV